MNPTIGQVYRSVISTWRLRGARGLLDVGRDKLYWHRQDVRFRIDLATWRIVERAAGAVVAQGSIEELRGFRESHPGLPVQFYADLTHGGRRFYLGLVDGEIGHISWVYTEEDRGRHMRLAPGDMMLEGAYTFARFRGRGLLSAVERAALDDAKREGRRAAYTHVAIDNPASLRGVWKTGFRPVGLLTWCWVLGVCHSRYVDSADRARLGTPRRDGAALTRAAERTTILGRWWRAARPTTARARRCAPRPGTPGTRAVGRRGRGTARRSGSGTTRSFVH